MDIIKKEFQKGVVLYVATGANVMDIDDCAAAHS